MRVTIFVEEIIIKYLPEHSILLYNILYFGEFKKLHKEFMSFLTAGLVYHFWQSRLW